MVEVFILTSRTLLASFEPVREKTNNLGFRPGRTQTGLNSHRRWLVAANFGFRKKRKCTFRVAKIKALISLAVTAKLICAFVFDYADCWFSHAAAQIRMYYFCVNRVYIVQWCYVSTRMWMKFSIAYIP